MKYFIVLTIFSVVVIGCLYILPKIQTSAQTSPIMDEFTVTNRNAGQVSGYEFTVTCPNGISLGESVIITFPVEADLNYASLDELLYEIGGTKVASVSVSTITQQVDLTSNFEVGNMEQTTISISQDAGIINPNISQEKIDSADTCPDYMPDTIYQIKVATDTDPSNASTDMEIDDWLAIETMEFVAGQEVVVNGGGFMPGGYLVYLNSLHGGPLSGNDFVEPDGTINIVAIATGNSGTLNATDGTGRCVGIPADEFTILKEVAIEIVLQGTERPSPEGWEIPITIAFFGPEADVLYDIPLKLFTGTTTAISTGEGTRAYFICPDPINPGTYDITADSSTTLLNVKRNVGIW